MRCLRKVRLDDSAHVMASWQISACRPRLALLEPTVSMRERTILAVRDLWMEEKKGRMETKRALKSCWRLWQNADRARECRVSR